MALRNTLKYNQYRGSVKTSEAAETAITTTELENWLKIPAGDETSTLTLIIESATEFVEKLLGCSIINKSYQLTLDNWPLASEPWWDGVREAHRNVLVNEGRAADIEIPYWPLSSIDSMVVDGNTVTVNDVFIVDTVQRYGRLVLRRGATWPVISNATANAIVIDYTAGFGATAADVPSDIKLALMQMSAYLFEHRGDGCSADDAYKKSGAKDSLSVYKVGRL